MPCSTNARRFHGFRGWTFSLLRVIVLGITLRIATADSPSAAADTERINGETTSYDFHPVAATAAGGTWYAWHGYRQGRDQLFARHIDTDGRLGEVHTVSQNGTIQGPPTLIGELDDSIAVLWSTRANGRWQIVMRTLQGNRPPVILSNEANDAIYPAAVALADGTVFAAWSAHVAGHWRVRGCRITDSGPQPIIDISGATADAFRPALAAHEGRVWTFWDQYEQANYSIHGRVVFPQVAATERVSPPDEYCLKPTALSHPQGLHVAWLRKQDVIGGPGVISQYHTLHAAVRSDDQWRLILAAGNDSAAAHLTQGLMAKIAPRPIATGGYLGPRTRPMLIADGDRVWLLWERKSDHRGSTPRVSGDLVGRPSRNGRWEAPVVLEQGRIDYHPIHPAVARDGKVRMLASQLPRHGIRHYDRFEIALATGQPLQHEAWAGWKPVTLPIADEMTPRRSLTSEGRQYKLYWADLHCHNGLTADAEGEPDEMHFYARDRARLDVVVFTNNDFYNVPLTQYDFALGHLFARTYSTSSTANQREFLSLPGFEWTSRIPGVATAELSDPGNWLPPYRNRSYPNHRSVIYPPGGGPLVHFTEVGNDIAKLNAAVDRAGGITLSQHNAFKLSGHRVEVGMELTSGWSNYIASHPHLFHEPLNQGARLGFTANGDTHRRAPGLSGALTGIYATRLTADSILEALRKRRCFATMGSRMFLDTRAGDAIMGGETRAVEGQVTLTLHAIGTRPITRASLIRDGKMIEQFTGEGGRELRVSFTDKGLATGTHWYYWRVSQDRVSPVLPGNLMPAHGHLAWSSPSWVVVE